MITHVDTDIYVGDEVYADLLKRHAFLQEQVKMLESDDKKSVFKALSHLEDAIQSGIWQHWKSTSEHPMQYFVCKPGLVDGIFKVDYVALYEDLGRNLAYGKTWPRWLVSPEGVRTSDEQDGFLEPIDREWNGVRYRCPRFTLVASFPENALQPILMNNRPSAGKQGKRD